jgi:toxin ParE1/3/4
MVNYRLAPEAKADLERIWIYGLENWGLEAADKYYAAFFEHFKQVAEQPYLYPAADIREGYRRSVCGADSVYYRVVGEAVEIMAVIGRQQADDWL